MSSYHVPAEGPLDAEVAVVAEKAAWSEVQWREATGKPIQPRPLIGSSGDYLRTHLKNAGMNPGTRFYNENKPRTDAWDWTFGENVFLTNAVANFDEPGSNPAIDDLWPEQLRLVRELASMPNLKVIIALGNFALASLGNMAYSKIVKGKLTGIGNWRGSVIPSIVPSRFEGIDWVKMVPTYHPSFYMHGSWEWKNIVQFDISRAVENRKFPERRHTEREYHVAPTFDEAISWFDEIEHDLNNGAHDVKLKNGNVIRPLGFDIECATGKYNARYVVCRGFATSPTKAYCFPNTFNNRAPYFTLKEEAIIWLRTQKLFKREDITFITQNGPAFDLWIERQHGIIIPPSVLTRGFDTMHAHALLAADLPHSLDFLVSLSTDETFYKNESGEWNVKSQQFVKTPERDFWIYNCKDSCLTVACALDIMNDLIEAGELA